MAERKSKGTNWESKVSNKKRKTSPRGRSKMWLCSCKAVDKSLQPPDASFSVGQCEGLTSWLLRHLLALIPCIQAGQPLTGTLNQDSHGYGGKALGASGNGPRKSLSPAQRLQDQGPSHLSHMITHHRGSGRIRFRIKAPTAEMAGSGGR